MDKLSSFGIDHGESSSVPRILFAVVCWLSAAATGIVAMVLAMAGVMGSAPCRPRETTFICTGLGQSVAWWLPLAGWAVSVLLTWVIAGRVGGRSRMRWLGVAAGLVVFTVVVGVDWVLVAT